MSENSRRAGWKIFIYSLILGPVFLTFHLIDGKKQEGPVKYLSVIPAIALLPLAYFSYCLVWSPWWTAAAYAAALIIAVAVAGYWSSISGKEGKEGDAPPQKPRAESSFVRAFGWMIFTGILFFTLISTIHGIFYWLLGEYIAVDPLTKGVFSFSVFSGMTVGFKYGIRKDRKFMSSSLKIFFKATALIYIVLALIYIVVLLALVYPTQKLAPISYSFGPHELIFVWLFIAASVLCPLYFISSVSRRGFLANALAALFFVPLVAVHICILSGYSTTLNLLTASIVEGTGNLSKAKEIYLKVIPHVNQDGLIASLNHRLGVMEVLQKNYTEGLSFFQKVAAEYSDDFKVYSKAQKYIESYDQNAASEDKTQTILKVSHTTFEQAASCFPNSLSLILSFYEDQKVSARTLSYEIKERIDQGTFIWKAESFLNKNGYGLTTSYWQQGDTLKKLIAAGYPVLVYVPGHVFVLFGFDEKMEMYFSYDTAVLNRWDDKPFDAFYQDWMSSSFMMSVVVKNGSEQALRETAPELFKFSQAYALVQKAQISEYYEQKDNYWKDYDQNEIAEEIGPAALKLTAFNSGGGRQIDYDWNDEDWNETVFPVLQRPWAVEWPVFKRYLIYLFRHGKTQLADQLLNLYDKHLMENSQSTFADYLTLKLAAAVMLNDENKAFAISSELINSYESRPVVRYWAHYYKAMEYLKRGEPAAAVNLLIPIVNELDFSDYDLSAPMLKILDLLDETACNNPDLLDGSKKGLLEAAMILYGQDSVCR